MPTIPQLPPASGTGAQDEIPVSQNGITRSVTVSELLLGTQPAITVASQTLIGRVSLGPGGPESIAVGTGLGLASAALVANGGDHASFSLEASLALSDEAILNSSGTPTRLPLPLLRGLFTPGSNVAISGNGQISASTDAAVTTQLQSLGQGLTTTEANLAALSARVPTGGYVTLNAQGQMTAPIAGPASLGTVIVTSGAPSRTLAAKSLDTINLVDLGAIAGGSDCSAAFNAAFAALPASGGEMFIPAGDFWLRSPVIFSGKAVTLRGAGRGITRLHFSHSGIGFDFVPGNVLAKIVLRDLSAYAENTTTATAAVARITYPSIQSLGYVSASISEIECFGYPNAQNGVSPFPQTFTRGFILNNCWSTQISNISWFGPPSAAGASSSAVIELNRAVDTRISGLQAYFGNAVVLQTGYCEGIYIINPVAVGVDYLFLQTDETTWQGYGPAKAMLLGLWVYGGEVNTNLGIAQLDNVTIGVFSGLDLSRNGGPNTSKVFFNCTNVSNFHFDSCNFVGGPTGGSNQDIGFTFSSTWNSSGNIISDCHFEDMATLIKINGANGTVGLTTHDLHLGNVPVATAVIDNTPQENGNYLTFVTPAVTGVPAGLGSTKDHVLASATGATLFRVNNVPQAANYLRHQPAAVGSSPTLCFDGTDGIVSGVIQTKGGNITLSGAGGTSGSANLASFTNIANASNWIQFQNATSGNLSLMTTNAGGVSLQPRGPLWLSPTNGVFVSGLPTTRPIAGSNQIWNNGGVVSIA